MSILLLLIALASVTAVTAAWFSISDNARIKSMNMEITTGVSMRFDLDAHGDYSEYIETLNFNQIADRMQSNLGFDMRAVPLDPVTTSDASTFTLENGTAVEPSKGSYLSFTLHFIAQEDMVVHLTNEDSPDKAGTLISSSNPELASAMRISFTTDGVTYVYDPGLGDTSSGSGYKTFGLPSGTMVYNDNNAMFSLEKLVDKPVDVHIWLEGTDENCTDSLKNTDYKIALKFQGTDPDNTPFKDAERPGKEDNVTGDPSKEYYTQRDQTADERQEEKKLNFIQRLKKTFNEVMDSVVERNAGEDEEDSKDSKENS